MRGHWENLNSLHVVNVVSEHWKTRNIHSFSTTRKQHIEKILPIINPFSVGGKWLTWSVMRSCFIIPKFVCHFPSKTNHLTFEFLQKCVMVCQLAAIFRIKFAISFHFHPSFLKFSSCLDEMTCNRKEIFNFPFNCPDSLRDEVERKKLNIRTQKPFNSSNL